MNIADDDTLVSLAGECGLDGIALFDPQPAGRFGVYPQGIFRKQFVQQNLAGN